MAIVFTICSNNYLAQAKTLGDSLLKYNPDYLFVIGLVDKFSSEIDYSYFEPYLVVPVEDIGIHDFEEMFFRYNIIELNTAVKPFFFHYLFNKYRNANSIIYLDPDIYFYDKFYDLEQKLVQNNIVLTPHFFNPIFDNYLPSESTILNAGLYNLGFIGLKRSEETKRFLDWWMIKLKYQCFIDFSNGLFVDQLWINLVPLYFRGVFILDHLGYNVAYWNLHERKVSWENSSFVINYNFPLVFFHFSGYNFNNPGLISKYQTRFNFGQREDVEPLFRGYLDEVTRNKFQVFQNVECYYVQEKRKIDEEQKKIIMEQQKAERRLSLKRIFNSVKRRILLP